MARAKMDESVIEAWLQAHPGWKRQGATLERSFSFPDYPSTISFVTRLAFAAEKRDHHPDLQVSWGRVTVSWTTHDAGGLTQHDLAMAEHTDSLTGA